jgi:hypothetical protein
MKKIIISLLLVSVFAFSPKKVASDPNKKYKITLELNIQEYNALLSSISSSDAFSAKAANLLSQSIILQLQPQLAQEAREDSLKVSKPKK